MLEQPLVNWTLFLVGLTVYALAMWDVFVTTISLHGGGPLTNQLLRFAGYLLRVDQAGFSGPAGDVIDGRPVARRFVRYSNLAITLSLFIGWVSFVLLGATLILLGDPLAVLSSTPGGAPASAIERLYFAGVAITTLGFGDFVPATSGWRVFSVLLATSGLVVSSLGITYVVNVVGASLQQRTIARRIHNLGTTPRAILASGWSGKSFAGLNDVLESLATELLSHTQQHLSYPMIHYVRSERPHDSLPANVAVLDEALSLLLIEVPREQQPRTTALVGARRAITAYLESIDEIYIEGERSDLPRWPDTDFLKQNWSLPPGRGLGSLTDEERIGLERRRRLIHGVVISQGRSWDEAFVTNSSPDARYDIDLFASAYAVPRAHARELAEAHYGDYDHASDDDLPR